MTHREWVFVAVGVGVLGASVVLTRGRPAQGGEQIEAPVRPATLLQYGQNNFARGGAADRFGGYEDGLSMTSFIGEPSYAQYANKPYDNLQGEVTRHQPGIEFTAGFADQTTLGGTVGPDNYMGDNPLAFQDSWIEEPPWRRA